MKKLGDWFWGWFFITMGSISLVGFLYAAILSKLLPPSDNVIISSIQNDCHANCLRNTQLASLPQQCFSFQIQYKGLDFQPGCFHYSGSRSRFGKANLKAIYSKEE